MQKQMRLKALFHFNTFKTQYLLLFLLDQFTSWLICQRVYYESKVNKSWNQAEQSSNGISHQASLFCVWNCTPTIPIFKKDRNKCPIPATQLTSWLNIQISCHSHVGSRNLSFSLLLLGRWDDWLLWDWRAVTDTDRGVTDKPEGAVEYSPFIDKFWLGDPVVFWE